MDAIGGFFSQVLLGSVDDGLLVLGERARYALYYHIEKSYLVKREQIPDRIAEFHEALEKIFHDGCRVVEKLIARSLYQKLALSFEEHKEWTLVDYVNAAKDHASNSERVLRVGVELN
jgi:hypothetical protein